MKPGRFALFCATAMLAILPALTGPALAQETAPAAKDATSPAHQRDDPVPPPLEAPETTPRQDKPKSLGESAIDSVNPTRFGKGPEDAAFGAYQRGLYKTAYNLAMPRAEAGDAAAQVLVADMLARGLGVRADLAQSAKWYAKAAEQGTPEAQFRYAGILLEGKYAAKDAAKAKELMKAAADAGNAAAQFNFGQILMQEHPGTAGLDRAYPWFEKAAEKGLPDGQYAVSQILANGTPTTKRDDIKARQYLVRAAVNGYDTAQMDLGTWLVEGRGGKRDYTAGFRWMSRAAGGGNVAAQARLAKLYRDGLGVEGDSIKAAAWYIVARRAGLNDYELNSFMDGLDDDQMQAAIAEANKLR